MIIFFESQKLSQMKATIALRNQLGLTQIEMAACLELTLSQLGMYETNKRDLPTKALVKLAQMEQMLLSIEATNVPPLPVSAIENERTLTFLALQINELNRKQQLLQNKWSKMQQQARQSKTLATFLELMQHDLTFRDSFGFKFLQGKVHSKRNFNIMQDELLLRIQLNDVANTIEFFKILTAEIQNH